MLRTQAKIMLPWEDAAVAAADIWGFHLTDENRHDEEFVALRDAYRDILTAYTPGLTNPLIVNSTICGDHGDVRWRTGIPAEFKGLPKSEFCKRMFEEWWSTLYANAPMVAENPDEDARYRYCYEQYATLLCIRPFRNANGRTALVLLYQLRRFCGLPFVIYTSQNIGVINASVKEYRRNTFIPCHAGDGTLGRMS